MVMAIHGSYKIKYDSGKIINDKRVGLIEIDFTPPFKRIPMMKGIEEALGHKMKEFGMKMPKNKDLHTPETRKFFEDLCKKLGVECKEPRTTARLIDTLVGEFIEI